jgi:hypothetical protein
MAEMTRDRLTCLTDDELLVYQREHHGDSYMTLAETGDLGRSSGEEEGRQPSTARIDELIDERAPHSSAELPNSADGAFPDRPDIPA